MTTLVTGASGFVGPHLATALLGRGHRVIGVDIAESASQPECEFYRIDITDPPALGRICRGIDTVIHGASVIHDRRTPSHQVWRVNFDGTRNLLDVALAGGVSRFIYLSSASVIYAGAGLENADESFPYAERPLAPYAASKIEAEKLVLAHNARQGMATCAIRPHVVFGPGDRRFLPAILQMDHRWFPPAGIGGEKWLSDFTYIDNLVDAVLLAEQSLARDGTNSAAAGQAYFITNGEPIPFWSFVSRIRQGLGLDPIRLFLPGPVALTAATVREAFARLTGTEIGTEGGLSRFTIRYLCSHHYFAIEKARRDLGYRPAIKLDEGIARTCHALRAICPRPPQT